MSKEIFICGKIVDLMTSEVALAKEEENDGWNIVNAILPDGKTFRIAYKGNVIRLRKPHWIPIELIFPKQDNKDSTYITVQIKEDKPYE